MRRASISFSEVHQAEVSGPPVDKYAFVLVLACAFVTVIDPLLIFGPQVNIQNAEPGLANRIFWPAAMVLSVAFALANHARLGKTSWPTHLTFLLVYIAFAGASTLWAYKPETSLVRYAQQVMVVSSILLPGMLAARTTDLMRGVFLCCAIGVAINVYFVLDTPPSIKGYSGYWSSKNALGEFSAVTLLLALNEMRYPGLRRVLGIIISLLAGFLIVMSDSKTALALALSCPLLAVVVLAIRRTMRVSPAVLLVSILLCYGVVSELTGFTMYRVSYILYGDPTFTGRSYIWDFAFSKIADKPLLGWGYQSFWLVGSDAPSVVDAPGFVKNMPNAHNGYFDTMLELGYIGWGLLMVFILTTLHAVGRVADRFHGRAWSMLTIALYVIIYNGLESFWMRGYEFLWVVFLILAVDIRRYLLPLPLTRAAERAIRTASPLTTRVRLSPQSEAPEQESRVSHSLCRAQLHSPRT
jgi:exopolysaccharide production protein ExoQ